MKITTWEVRMDGQIVPTKTEDLGVENIVDAARQRLIANETPCPKCGANWGLIARCAAEDCPSTEARLALFNELIARHEGEAEPEPDIHVPGAQHEGEPSAEARKEADRMIGYTGEVEDQIHDARILEAYAARKVAEAVAAERERCAQFCAYNAHHTGIALAATIRVRALSDDA